MLKRAAQPVTEPDECGRGRVGFPLRMNSMCFQRWECPPRKRVSANRRRSILHSCVQNDRKSS